MYSIGDFTSGTYSSACVDLPHKQHFSTYTSPPLQNAQPPNLREPLCSVPKLNEIHRLLKGVDQTILYQPMRAVVPQAA
jgi:hypothetical protein